MKSPIRLWLLALLPLGYLWFVAINHLRIEWTVSDQYSYGWVVPLLCVGLAFRAWEAAKAGAVPQRLEANEPAALSRLLPLMAAFSLLSVLFLPTRVLIEADPAWRLVGGLLALEVVGLTLCVVYLAAGAEALRRYAFPICFFLVAVPWPYPIEKALIERLTFAASACTVEVLGLLGVPAIQHGKVIEVSTGMVGINEACSGIRSFQSSLMIALFLGELYRLAALRRVWLVATGWLLAFLLNMCRTSLLTWVAAKKGPQAVADYHDFAGISISIACVVGLLGLALLLRRRVSCGPEAPVPRTVRPEERGQGLTVDGATAGGGSEAVLGGQSRIGGGQFQSAWLRPCLIGLLCWLACVEVGVNVWSRSGASAGSQATRWSIGWPVDNPSFQRSEPDGVSQRLLRYDEAQEGAWDEPDGTKWHVFYLNWLPGKAGSYLAASRHAPEICMTYAGWTMISGPETLMVGVGDLRLAFRKYAFEKEGRKLYVFHCHWDATPGITQPSIEQPEADSLWRGMRGLRGVFAGRGKAGQKIVEVIIQGHEDPQAAQAELISRLERLIVVEGKTVAARE